MRISMRSSSRAGALVRRLLQPTLASSDSRSFDGFLCYEHVPGHWQSQEGLMRPLMMNAAISAFRARREFESRRKIFQDGMAWKEVAAGKAAQQGASGCVAVWRARKDLNSRL